jgi:hypothetical protein
MNTFENWCDSQNIPATTDRRAVWNAALEEGAKAAYEVRKQAVDKFANADNLSGCDAAYQQVVAAEKITRAIRAMQTTAGAAGGEVRP